jgi:hypothetical protein
MGKAWCTKIDSASSQALIGTGAETRNAIRRRVATEFDWKLVTDLPIRSRQDAIEKLQWYAMRWKIETFHKIFKSGFKAEEVRLRAAERIVNLIAILCLLSWRVFWMTMINRTLPEAAPELALTPTKLYLLDQLVRDKPGTAPSANTLSLYLTKLARLGGYLARAKILRQETSSCGEASRASQISSSDLSSVLNLWVLESWVTALH